MEGNWTQWKLQKLMEVSRKIEISERLVDLKLIKTSKMENQWIFQSIERNRKTRGSKSDEFWEKIIEIKKIENVRKVVKCILGESGEQCCAFCFCSYSYSYLVPSLPTFYLLVPCTHTCSSGPLIFRFHAHAMKKARTSHVLLLFFLFSTYFFTKTLKSIYFVY